VRCHCTYCATFSLLRLCQGDVCADPVKGAWSAIFTGIEQLRLRPRKILLTVAPPLALAAVLAVGLRIVQSDPIDLSTQEPIVAPQSVAAESVVIEAKSDPTAQPNVETVPSEGSGEDADKLWGEIDQAISGLNDLVGVEMFLDVRQGEESRLEVLLEKKYWDRVSYVTRVNLKSDISNLWHLYVKEYRQFDTSVVYFIDEANDKVIDIFSQAN